MELWPALPRQFPFLPLRKRERLLFLRLGHPTPVTRTSSRTVVTATSTEANVLKPLKGWLTEHGYATHGELDVEFSPDAEVWVVFRCVASRHPSMQYGKQFVCVIPGELAAIVGCLVKDEPDDGWYVGTRSEVERCIDSFMNKVERARRSHFPEQASDPESTFLN